MTIHHIGYLVKKIDKAVEHFRRLGFVNITEIKYDEYRDVDIIFMEKDGYVIELVSPKSKDSVVGKLLDKYKNSPYHICFESDNYCADEEYLEKNGFMKIDNPQKAPAISDKEVTFFISSHMGIIELINNPELFTEQFFY